MSQSQTQSLLNINMFIYGIKITKYFTNKKKKHKRIFYIHEEDIRYLQWISPKKQYTKSRINLSEIESLQQEVQAKKVLIKTPFQQLTLEFQTNDEMDQFVYTLKYFQEKAIQFDKNEYKKDQIKHEAEILFIHADSNGNMNLDIKEIKKILKQMQISINKQYLIKLIEEYDTNQNGQIDKNEFVSIIRKLSRKFELEKIFSSYCVQYNGTSTDDQNNLMTVIQFQQFSKQEQKESPTLLEIIHSFKALAHDQQETLRISFDQFSQLIFNEKNSILDPINNSIWQDMDQPLTSYYINSSHNTYLLSNQLIGESSTKAYINALEKGCRCLELDCWDGENFEPIIYHGYTLTSRILFREVIQVINDNAFKYSEYPLILSFENHCSENAQKKMAEICVEIFKDKLFKVPVDWQAIESYLSPNKLRKKIIIKNSGKLEQAINKDVFFNQILVTQQEIDDEDESNILLLQQNLKPEYMRLIYKNSQCFPSKIVEKQLKNKKISEKQGKKCTMYLQQNHSQVPQTTTANTNTEHENLTNEQNNNSFQTDLNKKIIEMNKSRGNIISRQQSIQKNIEIPQLIKITSMFGCKMKFDDKNRKCWHISSVDEVKFNNLYKKNPKKLIEFTSKHFIRLYPSGIRVDSSNYDPMIGFLAGCQLIALNFQTLDFPLFFYLSKFQENGGIKSGYVLKPECLLKNQIEESRKVKLSFKIQIISAQKLKPNKENKNYIVDPFVQIFIRGHYIDEQDNLPKKTKTIFDNGFHPVWEESQEFTFNFVYPELAFIFFRVMDSDVLTDRQIGIYCCPVQQIRQGYRVVPLYDALDHQLIKKSFLLVKIINQ